MTTLLEREENIPFHKTYISARSLVTLLYEPYGIFVPDSFVQEEHIGTDEARLLSRLNSFYDKNNFSV